MVTMERNTNLEEINEDAFLDIPFLSHQSIIQKIEFWGSIVIAVVWNIVANFMLHMNPALIVIFTLMPILIGVLFGCNYNADLSLIKYIFLVMKKPSIILVSRPTEDLQQIKTVTARIIQDKEIKQKQASAASPEEQKKLLIKIGVGSLLFILVFIMVIVLLLNGKTQEIHHIVKEK